MPHRQTRVKEKPLGLARSGSSWKLYGSLSRRQRTRRDLQNRPGRPINAASIVI